MFAPSPEGDLLDELGLGAPALGDAGLDAAVVEPSLSEEGDDADDETEGVGSLEGLA